jgi:hypothetical protein
MERGAKGLPGIRDGGSSYQALDERLCTSLSGSRHKVLCVSESKGSVSRGQYKNVSCVLELNNQNP